MEIFIFLTILLWIDLILSFISKSFNEMIIQELEKQNKKIDARSKHLKKLFIKYFKN